MIEHLIQRQGNDGGWPYAKGPSWTETTLYGALACKAFGAAAGPQQRAFHWLAGLRQPDGGWAPCREVTGSTWVTSLILLLSPDDLGKESHDGAVRWVLSQTGKETSWRYRLHLLLSGERPASPQDEGWPWFPGAAAWVSPTASAIIGLRQASRFSSDPAIHTRIEEGQRYLLSHACGDGGWNHGGAQALGYQAESYPETTGLALLALRGVGKNQLGRAFARARQMAATCRSPEGASWLKMGLQAHGQADGLTFPEGKTRTVRDLCLEAVAEAQLAGKLDL